VDEEVDNGRYNAPRTSDLGSQAAELRNRLDMRLQKAQNYDSALKAAATLISTFAFWEGYVVIWLPPMNF